MNAAATCEIDPESSDSTFLFFALVDAARAAKARYQVALDAACELEAEGLEFAARAADACADALEAKLLTAEAELRALCAWQVAA